MKEIRFRMKPYIQPFERRLAIDELRALSFGEPESVDRKGPDTVFHVQTFTRPITFVDRLAYWETVEHGSQIWTTRQSLRESTVNVVRNGIDISDLARQLPFPGMAPLPNRRCLRYGTHGIHEYRGKFFPQLVRSLMNIAGVRAGEIVADPMSGSGTTQVEAVLTGCRGLGIDMNPLSVFLARTKCELLTVKASTIVSSYEKIRTRLLRFEAGRAKRFPYFECLPEADRNYLTGWFSEDVLAGLDEISSAIELLDNDGIRNLMRVSLSNIIRKVSWQKDDDLRVRKEVRLDLDLDPKREFLEELGRSVRTLLAFLYQNGNGPFGPYKIVEGDARRCADLWSGYLGEVDTVITSPPYATALPYLDTDRLSLIYLGLLSRPEHRARDQEMIGNREVTDGTRRGYWERFENDWKALPKNVRSLISRVHELNSASAVGFRRKNLSALLAKYFFDMSEVLEGVWKTLKPGGLAFVVVGNNHTVAGGHRVEIKTASYLTDIAIGRGFEILETIPMDMLVSRDIFRKNALRSEEILTLRKPA